MKDAVGQKLVKQELSEDVMSGKDLLDLLLGADRQIIGAEGFELELTGADTDPMINFVMCDVKVKNELASRRSMGGGSRITIIVKPLSSESEVSITPRRRLEKD